MAINPASFPKASSIFRGVFTIPNNEQTIKMKKIISNPTRFIFLNNEESEIRSNSAITDGG